MNENDAQVAKSDDSHFVLRNEDVKKVWVSKFKKWWSLERLRWRWFLVSGEFDLATSKVHVKGKECSERTLWLWGSSRIAWLQVLRSLLV